MRKIISFALSLIFALPISLTAFAAKSTVSENGGNQNIDVNAKYVDGVSSSTVYNVDVEWGAMEFTYNAVGTKTWNADTHEYAVSTYGTWAASGNEITVTNHSNTGIKADFTYVKEAEFDTVTGSFSQNSLTFPTAEGKAFDNAVLSGKTALTLNGTLASDKTAFTKVGKVTVTISKA